MSVVVLTLFVSGRTARSIQAIANLRRFSSENLIGRCRVTVVDVLEQRALAGAHKIMATPTLIKSTPAPECRIIGELSDTQRLLSHLALGNERTSDAVVASSDR
jgi:circadian clock protein KaiB